MKTKADLGARLMAACCIAGASLGSTNAWAQGNEAGDRPSAKGAEETIKDRARRLWREGLAALEADNAKLALARYRESMALYPHVGTFRNLGVVEVAFDEYAADGANHLAYYLAHKEGLSPEDRRKLETLLAKTEKRIGRLDIDVEPPDAILEIDRKRVEPPLTKRVLYVLPGKHEVMARLPDSRPMKQNLELDAGQREVLNFDLGPTGNDEPVAAEPNKTGPVVRTKAPAGPAEEHWPEAKLWAVVGGGALTALGLGVGIYGHVALGSARDDVKKARTAVDDAFGGESACYTSARADSRVCQRLDDANSDQQTAGSVATAGWFAAGTFAAATAVVWLLWPNEPGKSGTKHDASVRAVGPWASSRGAGWIVSGRF